MWIQFEWWFLHEIRLGIDSIKINSLFFFRINEFSLVLKSKNTPINVIRESGKQTTTNFQTQLK